MKIKLTTGYEYDLTTKSALAKLKTNISTMRKRKQLDRLSVIYNQVAQYSNYQGNELCYQQARAVHKLLASIGIGATPKNPEPKVANQPAPQTNNNNLLIKQPQQEVKEQLVLPKYGHPEKTSIEISYRDEGIGGGAFYDHYTFQKNTGYATQITLAAKMTTTDLKSYVKAGTTHSLVFGTLTEEGKKLPEVSKPEDPVGLLVIPGRAHETETKRPAIHKIRTEHEEKLIKDAINRGRPTIAICAGSWQLWQSYQEEGKAKPTIKHVDKHVYRKMPTINIDGSIGNNRQMHRIDVMPNTIVANAMQGKSQQAPQYPRVNSVHWAAPDETHIPELFEISATAKRDNTVAPKKNQDCTDGSIEAFETKHGAPIVGIQWHPEAYYKQGPKKSKTPEEDKLNRNLLTYMAKAGDAYNAKQKMLTEFKQLGSPAMLLKKTGIFKSQNSNITKEISNHQEKLGKQEQKKTNKSVAFKAK